MAIPRKKAGEKKLNVRLAGDTAARYDELQQFLSERDGTEWTDTDIVEVAVERLFQDKDFREWRRKRRGGGM